MAVVINSTSGEIDLDQTTPGIYVVTYTVQGVSYTQEVTVNAVDDATFSYSASAFCADASNQTPTITTPGGAFTTQDITFRPFQMLIEVPATGDLTFKLPATGTSFTIDWGDSSTVVNTNSGTVYYTYTSTGTIANYTVSIGAEGDTGAFTALNMLSSDNSSRNSVKEVKQWGSIAWTSLNQVMRRCYSVDVTATDTPDLSLNPSLTGAFQDCSSLTNSNGSIGNWDLSACTSLVATFATNSSTFNVDVSNWNTSNITGFNITFQGCSNFNQDLSTKITAAGGLAWDVSSVTTMNYMFNGCSSFNSSIYNWNTSNVTNMAAMFKGTSFNQPILTNTISAASSPTGSAYVAWDVSKVSDFGGAGAGFMNFNTNFNQDISNWKLKSTGNIDVQFMFDGASSFNSDISTKTISSGSSPYGTSYTAWDMSNVNGFQRVFRNASSFDQNLSTWSCLNFTTYGGHATFQNSGMSTANYTDTVVGFANQVYNNSGTPNTIFFGDQSNQEFDRARTYSSGNFTTAGLARDYLTDSIANGGANWTITGDTEIN